MNTLESPDAKGKTAGNNRLKGCFGILVILLSVFLVLNLLAGSTRILPGEAFSALFRRQTEGTSARIILNIRLPRLLAAAILGGGLSVRPSSGEGFRFPDICCRPSSETQSPDPLFWESPPVQSSLLRW